MIILTTRRNTAQESPMPYILQTSVYPLRTTPVAPGEQPLRIEERSVATYKEIAERQIYDIFINAQIGGWVRHSLYQITPHGTFKVSLAGAQHHDPNPQRPPTELPHPPEAGGTEDPPVA